MAPSLSRRLVSPLACAVVCLFVWSLALRAQSAAPTLAQAPLDLSPSVGSSSSGSSSSSSSAESRDVSLSLLPGNFVRDQKTMWSFPWQLAKGKEWAPAVTVSAATLALLSADPHVDPYFNHTPAFRGFNHVFGSNITGAETILIPSALYAIGRYTGDSYMEKTALFAGEAVADSEMLRVFMNSVTTRWRPQDIFRQRTYSNTFFHSKSFVGSSFPSGHMIAASAIATVIARRYRSHRWVPWASYGLAGVIGFSRVTLHAHFPSDVFLGTVLGYGIGRYDVLQDN